MKFDFSKITVPLVLVGFFLTGASALAFDDLTTHPAITDEIVDFYNIFSEDKLSAEEKEWIISGVVSEDTPPRWVNHFYDPIHKTGWTGENTGRVPAWLMRYLAENFLSFTAPVPAPDWLHNQELQAEYHNYLGNRTWEKALYEYANGNKKEAYVTLGHTLHLMEDMAVPDHTRDDPHAHEARTITGDYGSPLEEYAKDFTRENFKVADELAVKGMTPIQRGEVDNYFYALANYSNGYFFSKDTINDPKYANPKIIREDEIFGYGIDKNGEEFKLVKIVNLKKDKFNVDKIYTLLEEEKERFLMKNYFSRLSREAIINGAGLIELFHQEAEAIIAGQKPVPEIFVKENGVIKEIVTLNGYIGGVSAVGEGAKAFAFAKDSYSSVKENISAGASKIASVASSLTGKITDIFSLEASHSPEGGDGLAAAMEAATSLSRLNLDNEVGEVVDLAVFDTVVSETAESSSNLSFSASITQIQASLEDIKKQTMALMEEDKKKKNSESEKNQTALNLVKSESTDETDTVRRADSSASRSLGDFDKSEADNQPRIIFLGLPYSGFGGGAAPKVSLVSESEQGEDQEEEDEQETVSLSAPILSVSQCDYSLATDGCLLATTTVNFSWTAVSGADHYAISKNGEYATTIDLSFTANISDFSDYNFSISAISNATTSATSTQTVSIATIPLAINEVAWMGTQASTFDEWLEIKNNTDFIIDLSQWVLESQDGAPYIQLSGTIGPKEYLVLERRENTIVTSEASVLTYGNGSSEWAMHNNGNGGGEEILLSYASTTLDKTPAISGGDWTAGENTSSTTRKTMERVSSKESGSDTSNWATWGTNIEFIKSGQDAEGNSISGTPGQCNSVSFNNLNNGQSIYQDSTLEEGGCYYVSQNVQVSATSTLAIEPGVQVSLYLDDLEINGILNANGEENNPIVFDSFSGTPTANKIKISGNNGTSTLDNVVVSNTGGVKLNNGADLEITDSEFISNNAGIELNNNSAAIIENTTFASTTNEAIAAYGGSSVSLASSTITNTIDADAVSVYSSTLSMSSTTIDTVLDGDGMGAYNSTIVIASSTITNVLKGDGIGSYGSVITIATSTISDISDGDGIGLYSNSSATLSDVIIENVSDDGVVVAGGSEISGNATIEGEETEY
ncbi:MAG: hypothetical protein COV02_00795 [Candidatus Terrybacteria bacterium CG10_big_fil_rev_8_21_14_0_10_41_10]|uniref:LTD domain-containing protein n=1 Tax=Candidatus Terrybacteria bacterium CG10_big_fil_rev_8_21_14_0_10_41_10 TaxID=1975026 RepID=A0A2M8LAY1_9BACT|nr:MAG: hypothetical protein COV02_00795 [Candidatus Terrybacteria bacterium CG10_big_fil_rev_8_21_14_0_10_41_10]